MFLNRHFGRERRRRRRQLLNTSVRVLTETGLLDALGINISDVGMSLFAITNLPVDSRIQVELMLPQSHQRMRIPAVVRHRALYLYGVEFLGEADEQKERDQTILPLTKSSRAGGR